MMIAWGNQISNFLRDFGGQSCSCNKKHPRDAANIEIITPIFYGVIISMGLAREYILEWENNSIP